MYFNVFYFFIFFFQWSLRSNTTPDTRDVWTDTEKENDEFILYSDRSDSGIISPPNHSSHRQLDDNHFMTTTTAASLSPCDLSIDHIQHDDIRKRLIIMSKRLCYDDDDKTCLMQVLSLLNNLEALSQDQEISTTDVIMEVS